MSCPDRRHSPLWLAALALVLCALVAACSRTTAAEQASNGEPAKVTAIGEGGLHRITLTAEGARRIALATGTITQSDGSVLAVASAAVFYEADGTTWVYERTAPLTFQRARVTISRVDGATTELSAGPSAGTVVATVGVAELRGAEDGVPGEQ
jgi:hypothetical protein